MEDNQRKGLFLAILIMMMVMVSTNNHYCVGALVEKTKSSSSHCSGSIQECLLFEEDDVLVESEISQVFPDLAANSYNNKAVYQSLIADASCGRRYPDKRCTPKRNNPKKHQPCGTYTRIEQQPNKVSEWIVGMHGEFSSLAKPANILSSRNRQVSSWFSPLMNIIKVCTDVAFCSKDNVAGLGAISRSCLGQIVSRASTLIPLNVSVVEAQTLELGFEIVESQGWQ
ncbi:hypothetical protein Godav_025385 [Gossypium davidsonii]|uniref:Uncharacterized protein n=1 Tax=Gossypium davidsonii TaxID=34287 RepID=A0A7J8T7W6_GOSDV|nr:hypothetical protein [Gossypium davidsonii]